MDGPQRRQRAQTKTMIRTTSAKSNAIFSSAPIPSSHLDNRNDTEITKLNVAPTL
jgi:hypothetical protein